MNFKERWKAESSLFGKILIMISVMVPVIAELLQWADMLPADILTTKQKAMIAPLLILMGIIGKYTVKSDKTT